MTKATRPTESNQTVRRAAWLSLLGAVVILALKLGAYLLTGSVGFLSDAAESVVNLVAGGVLLLVLWVSVTPPDYRHPYGHSKAEYLSSVLEAALIIVAAFGIAYAAIERLLNPRPLQQVALGVLLSAAAALLNGGLAFILFRVARRQRSAALDANARHVLTDVWTSAGVIAGVVAVSLTGWQVLDVVVALVVVANIVRVGVGVMRRSISELLDERLPEKEEAVILEALDSSPQVRGYHRLRTRRSGRARFAEVDVFVDPSMSVREAHALVARLELDIHEQLTNLVTTVHVEPFEPGVRDTPRTPHDEFPGEAV